jgi:hypothetical protein
VLRGPAVVVNLYTEPVPPRARKYFRGPTIRVGLYRNAGEVAIFSAEPTPAITWRTASSGQDKIGRLSALEELLISPAVPDILKDPQLHCQARTPAWPGGAG